MNPICIGCGCTESRACPGGCSWTRIDREANIGVCSRCVRSVADWDAGQRTLSDQAHRNRHARCRSCNAAIIWFTTNNGRKMPVDAATVKPMDVWLNMGHHISHFATCPDRDKHRKER